MILNALSYQKKKLKIKNFFLREKKILILNALNNFRQEATYNLIYTTHIFFLTHTNTYIYNQI